MSAIEAHKKKSARLKADHIMDVSVPLKDSSDAELLAELEHRHLGISEALGNHERVARGNPVGAWKPSYPLPSSTDSTPPIKKVSSLSTLNKEATAISRATNQAAGGVVYEFAPRRAWVNGQEDVSALIDAEELYLHRPAGHVGEQLRAQNAKLMEENRLLGLRVQFEAQRGHIGALRLKVNAAAQSEAKESATRRRIGELEAKLDASFGESERLAARLRAAEERLAALQAQHQQAQEQLHQAKAQTQSEASARSVAVQREKQLVLSLQSAQQQAAQQHAAFHASVHTDLNALRQELARSKAMAHEATAGLTRQVADNEQLLALLTEEEGVSSGLRAELERLKRELVDQQATLTARGSASDSWQRERLTLEGRLREAESATGAARADRERLAAQLRDLELKLAAKDGEAGQATDDLERKLREAEAAVRTLQGEREQSERRLRSLEAEREHDRERARHEKESLEGRLREAEGQAAKLSADKAEAERRLREALQHSQSMESRVTSLTRENLLLSADFDVCARCPLPCAASDGLGSWLLNYARATR